MATLLVGLGNIPTRANFTVVNPQIKSAVGIVAYPCFVHDRCPIAPIIRQRYQNTRIALQTLWKCLLHKTLLSTGVFKKLAIHTTHSAINRTGFGQGVNFRDNVTNLCTKSTCFIPFFRVYPVPKQLTSAFYRLILVRLLTAFSHLYSGGSICPQVFATLSFLSSP